MPAFLQRFHCRAQRAAARFPVGLTLYRDGRFGHCPPFDATSPCRNNGLLSNVKSERLERLGIPSIDGCRLAFGQQRGGRPQALPAGSPGFPSEDRDAEKSIHSPQVG